MSVPVSLASSSTPLERLEHVIAGTNLTVARTWADCLGVPLAYLYADNSDLAEVILAFGLLPEPEQRRLAMELKARVSPPASKARRKCRAPAARRKR